MLTIVFLYLPWPTRFDFIFYLQVLAIVEKDAGEDNSDLDVLIEKVFSREEIFSVEHTTQGQRSLFFEPVFEAALR